MSDNYFLLDAIEQRLPGRRKTNPNQFVSFDCPVCVTRGESRHDTKGRCGIKTEGDGSFGLSCLNCGFKTRWRPGDIVWRNVKLFMTEIGFNTDEIKQLSYTAWRLAKMTGSNLPEVRKPRVLNFEAAEFPPETRPVEWWLEHELEEDSFLTAVEYVMERGLYLLTNYDFYWSPAPGFANRIIIPMMHHDTVVGYTARTTNNHPTRYLSKVPTGFIFNHDVLWRPKRQHIVVTEGAFDAMAVDGAALMGSSLSDEQAQWLKNAGKEVIVLPDPDPAGARLVERAVAFGFSVSLPFQRPRGADLWGRDENRRLIKDASAAALKYGRLFTLYSILHSRISDRATIMQRKKEFE